MLDNTYVVQNGTAMPARVSVRQRTSNIQLTMSEYKQDARSSETVIISVDFVEERGE
jgi:hypothetical protein